MIPVGDENDEELSLTTRDFVDRTFAQIGNIGSVGIRPETIQLSAGSPPGDPRSLASYAEVSGILPTGGNWIVELDIAGSPLFVSTNEPPEFNSGESVYFQVDQTGLHLFNLDGQRVAC